MKNIIIAAHPDDEVLGCGGLIAKYSQEQDFYVVILTGGADTRYAKEMENILRQNAIDANKIVGTKELFFEDLPNQGLETIPLTKVIQTIEKYINDIKPNRVFAQFGGDLNKDHKIVYEAAITACRPMPNQCVKELYAYNVPSSTEWGAIEGEKIFVPNIFVDIKDSLEHKIEAMKRYESECRSYPHPRSPEALRIHANYWGLCGGIEYAEPFKLIRKISEL